MRSSLAALVLIALVTGCHTPRAGKPLDANVAGNDPGAKQAVTAFSAGRAGQGAGIWAATAASSRGISTILLKG